MNTLFSVIEEFIDPFFSKNVASWLSLDKQTLFDFDLITLSSDQSKKIKNITLNRLINILLYLKFMRKQKKIFLKCLFLIENCTLVTFFTRTISFYAEFEKIGKISTKEKLSEPLKKLLTGILIGKKANEIANKIPYWKNFCANLLTNDLFDQSFQEVAKIKLIQTEYKKMGSKFNFFGSKWSYFLKKRFDCFFPVFFFQEFFLINNPAPYLNFKVGNINFQISIYFKKLLRKKNLSLFLNLLKTYSLEKFFEFDKYLKNKILNKKYHHVIPKKICGKKYTKSVLRAKKNDPFLSLY